MRSPFRICVVFEGVHLYEVSLSPDVDWRRAASASAASGLPCLKREKWRPGYPKVVTKYLYAQGAAQAWWGCSSCERRANQMSRGSTL